MKKTPTKLAFIEEMPRPDPIPDWIIREVRAAQETMRRSAKSKAAWDRRKQAFVDKGLSASNGSHR
jgi:hypothetical protein